MMYVKQIYRTGTVNNNYINNYWLYENIVIMIQQNIKLSTSKRTQ